DGGAGAYSDFLPFNSPYANTNGKMMHNYTYNGEKNEYNGVQHYQYDAKYDSYNNSVDNVGTNYWFGMSIDIDFYLPNDPGYRDSNGNTGNRDLMGNEMHFKFSGDDDVWVLLDGKLVLDIGGVHGIESGDINFSTGVITINGNQVGMLNGVASGEHTLTVLYLERGSSQSNCAIYFNLAPRFHFSIRKEDVLTQEVLNGAEFSVYTDKACTIPAELWISEEAFMASEAPTNVFAVTDGVAEIWGLSSGQTYYIKETKPPDKAGYSRAYGIICLTLDVTGVASYSVEVIAETDSNGNPLGPSHGFTVHGFRIDEETQEAFIVVTNAPDWVNEVTEVEVLKQWNDWVDHTYDSVTVYLTVTDLNGTVRRIREITLSNANGWKYTWDNLPKYHEDGVTPIVYGVEEAYKSGYHAQIQSITPTGGGFAFRITNIPLDKETSLTVKKEWDEGMGSNLDYQQAQVTIKLFANGKDTGRTITLSLKNGWTDTFRGLPYTDEDGNVISYTIEESWVNKDWLATYGEIKVIAGYWGNPPTYETTVTNVYRWGRGYELPGTGGVGSTPWIFSGLVMMLGSLGCGCMMRRKRERRGK
ncbi:MAG: Cna B-type domain-containing protein, partial [Oscillospiraceae bacterium]|nr:Cna B-type domain-containing protein [Oscillospiraceae bacterium]